MEIIESCVTFLCLFRITPEAFSSNGCRLVAQHPAARYVLNIGKVPIWFIFHATVTFYPIQSHIRYRVVARWMVMLWKINPRKANDCNVIIEGNLPRHLILPCCIFVYNYSLTYMWGRKACNKFDRWFRVKTFSKTTCPITLVGTFFNEWWDLSGLETGNFCVLGLLG